jgi:hypothetical protein
LKIDFSGRTVDAEPYPGQDGWTVRVGPVVLSPSSMTRLGALLREATVQEQMRLADSGYLWPARCALERSADGTSSDELEKPAQTKRAGHA